MNIAFEEAKKGVETWTNPQVGAVIVKDGQILAQGHHEKFGGPHAEINTLNHLDNIEQAKGAEMFVTLEPCSHFGKTPPCVQKVVEVGIKKVVIGQQDPNPVVSGHGIQYLKDNDVDVKVLHTTGGINEAYNFYYQKKRPLVTVKYAMTLDGKINQDGKNRSIITGKEAYHDSQNVRANNQAILIGENTLKVDDPQLTVRNQKMTFPPIRAVVVRDANKLANDLKLFQDPASTVLIFSEQASDRHFPDNVEVLVAKNWTPEKILAELTQRNIESVLVEGGSHLQADFVQANLVDQLIIYVAPKVFGGASLPAIFNQGHSENRLFEKPQVCALGSDLKITDRRLDDVHRNN